MKDKYYILFIVFFAIYSLMYGAYAYHVGNIIGLMVAINFYMLGGVLGIYLKNEKRATTNNRNSS